jgi:hypothetical protein
MNTNGSGYPNFDEWQMMTNYEALMHHEGLRMPKVQYRVLFSTFRCCLFFCKLMCLMLVFQWSGLGELVYVMEWIHGCCVYEECESWLLGMVGANVYKELEDGVMVKQ